MAFADLYDPIPPGVKALRRGLGARLGDVAKRVDWTQLGIALALCVFAFVGFTLYRTLSHIAWTDVLRAMGNVSWQEIAGAVVASAASYLALAGLDILALRQVGARKVPPSYAAFTSFVSHSFTFTLGFGVLTGGAVRLRLYQLKGLEPGSIVAAGILCALTFWMGLAAIAGICLVIEPGVVAQLYGVPVTVEVAIGAVILTVLAGWVVYSALSPDHDDHLGLELSLPGPGASLASMGIGIADTTFAALALWLLLPGDVHMAFPAFLVVFVIATVLGVVSHVPGGLGVFEAVMLLAVPSQNMPEAGRVAAAVPAGRLCRSVRAGGGRAWRPGSARPSTALNVAHAKFLETAGPLVRPVAAMAVFLGGFVLLVSGALPAEHDRIAVLRDHAAAVRRDLAFRRQHRRCCAAGGRARPGAAARVRLARRRRAAGRAAPSSRSPRASTTRKLSSASSSPRCCSRRGHDSTAGRPVLASAARLGSCWRSRSPSAFRSGSASWPIGGRLQRTRCGGISPITATRRASCAQPRRRRGDHAVRAHRILHRTTRRRTPAARCGRSTRASRSSMPSPRTDAQLATARRQTFPVRPRTATASSCTACRARAGSRWATRSRRTTSVAAELVWQFKELRRPARRRAGVLSGLHRPSARLPRRRLFAGEARRGSLGRPRPIHARRRRGPQAAASEGQGRADGR